MVSDLALDRLFARPLKGLEAPHSVVPATGARKVFPTPAARVVTGGRTGCRCVKGTNGLQSISCSRNGTNGLLSFVLWGD